LPVIEEGGGPERAGVAVDRILEAIEDLLVAQPTTASR
jgi:hypothetical protein